MKSCVTIDFDIIFGESLDCFLIGDATPMSELEEVNPLFSYIRPDYDVYRKVTAYIAKIMANKNIPIYFIDEHKHVLDYIDPKEEWKVFNIDHHSDLISGDMSEDEQTELNNGNWALFGFTDYNFKYYLHLSNLDSSKCTEPFKILENNTILGQYDVYMDSAMGYNFDLLNNPDMLVLCLSPQYVTEVSKPLYHLWKDIYEALRGNE